MLHLDDGSKTHMRVRSLVGLLPLLAVETLEPADLEANPDFAKRMAWFIENRPEFKASVACMETPGVGERRLLAIVWPSRLKRVLQRLFDEAEFFGDYGVRAVSRYHRDHPYTMNVGGADYAVGYEPAESSSGLFGGNSNWRGPVWFPINYLLIEALQKYHYYAGDALTVDVPSGSGNAVSLWDAASAIAHRLIAIFARDERGRRPVFGGNERMQTDPHWRDHVLFYEYFMATTARGWARAIRLVGPRSSPSCSSNARNTAANTSNRCKVPRCRSSRCRWDRPSPPRAERGLRKSRGANVNRAVLFSNNP